MGAIIPLPLYRCRPQPEPLRTRFPPTSGLILLSPLFYSVDSLAVVMERDSRTQVRAQEGTAAVDWAFTALPVRAKAERTSEASIGLLSS